MSDSTLQKLFPANRIREGLQARMQSGKPAVESPRRTMHGSHAWSLPSQNTPRQPQDGALTNSSQVSAMGDVNQPRKDVSQLRKNEERSLSASLREPEDAHLSGTMRSLARRVMGLNVTAAQRSAPVFQQPERYFAEPHLLKSLRRETARKVPDGAHATDLTRTNRPQVA